MTDSLDRCTIRKGQSLRDALRSLEASSAQVVLVVDERERVVGLMTDGDVRRALLQGGSLDVAADRFMSTSFVSVGPEANRAHVLDLMQSRKVNDVPILTVEGRLVGIHRLRDIVRRRARANAAVIMAGGRGTRLAPLTNHVTKPMIRVAGRPILERLVLHLVGSGVEEIFLAINYLGEQIVDHFGDGSVFGCKIRYLREEKPLGTGGALSLLPAPPTEPLLVMNGDLLTEADIGAMIDAHVESGAAVSVGVRRYFHNVPFGCIELEGERVVGLEEKPTLQRIINAGIYVVAPMVVARVPSEEYPITRLIEDALARGELVRAHEVREDWIDIGRREQLREARGGGE